MKERIPLGPYLPKKQLERRALKAFYKKKRAEDAVVGRQINSVIQGLHYQQRANREEVNPELIKASLNEISELRELPRFREEFPSFAKFKEFFKKSGLTLQDLRDAGSAD